MEGGEKTKLKKEEKKISEYLSNQIAKKEKNIKVCQLDLENLSSLTFLNKLNYQKLLQKNLLKQHKKKKLLKFILIEVSTNTMEE